MQERFHHRQDAFVSDRSTHPVHGGRVVDVVETRLDITFEHPLIRSRGELVNFGDRVMCPPFRTETIGTWFEVHLEDRFEHQLQGRLHGTVPRGRDAQSPAFTTTGFGNHPLTHRQRTELSDFDTISQPCRKPLLGGEDRSGRPLPSVAPDPRPRNNEDCRVTHKVEQVIEPAIRIIDRSLVQLGLDPQYLRLGPFSFRPQYVRIHRRSPTLPVLSLRTRCRPWPCDRLSRPRTTTTAPPRPDLLGRRRTDPPPTWMVGQRDQPGTLPTFTTSPVNGLGAQLCPCGITTSTPQTFLVASLPATSTSTEVARHRRACTTLRPISTRLEPAYLLRGFTHWFLTHTFTASTLALVSSPARAFV